MPARLAQRMLLFIASLILVIGAAEIGLRGFAPWWSDQWKMWRIDPIYARGLKAEVRNARVHSHSGEFVFGFSTNKAGLRMDREVSPKPPAGRQRILFVGDSLTFGYGVDQGMTFVDLLDKRARRAGMPFDFVNAGFASGFTLDTEYLFTRETASQLNPDQVIVGVCIANDLQDMLLTRWRVDTDELVSLEKHNDWIPAWIKRSAFVNWLVKGVVPGLRHRGTPANARSDAIESCSVEVEAAPPRPWRPGHARDPGPPGRMLNPPEKVSWLLDRWAREAAKAGYGLTLLLIPDGREVQTSIRPASLRERARVRGVFANAAEHAGVGLLDPVDAMRTHHCPDGEDLYFRRDGHWTEAGHRFVARWLFEQLATPGREARAEVE